MKFVVDIFFILYVYVCMYTQLNDVENKLYIYICRNVHTYVNK